jgi:hypothetical protein
MVPALDWPKLTGTSSHTHDRVELLHFRSLRVSLDCARAGLALSRQRPNDFQAEGLEFAINAFAETRDELSKKTGGLPPEDRPT